MNRRLRRDAFRKDQPRNIRKAVFGRWRIRYAGANARVHV